MSTHPQEVPACIVPTEAHRAAADRAMRLAHEHGAVEVAAFFADLPTQAQPVVFALMARSATSTLRPPDTRSPWWTAAELREAHRLWALGHRATWIKVGHRIYQAQNSRARRAELKVAQP